MKVKTLAFSLLIFMTAGAVVPANTWAENPRDEKFVGTALAPDGRSRFISPGSPVFLDIEPKIIVKGDALDVYSGSSFALNIHSNPAKAGRIIVTSGTGEPPRGEVVWASKEIIDKAPLSFSLDEKEQINVFLPFLQSLADTFLEKPLAHALRVAPIDIVDPYGDRTSSTDAAFIKLARHLCARSQFQCVDTARIENEMKKIGVSTSRGIDKDAAGRFRSALGADVIVSGRMKKSGGKTDLILIARNLKKPELMWRRFEFNHGELGLDGNRMEEVTVSYKEKRRGALKIRLMEVNTVEGMKADFFHYTEAKELFDRNDHRGIAGAGDFFMELDGQPVDISGDGFLYDSVISAGRHGVIFGFYPYVLANGISYMKSGQPVKKEMEIFVEAGAAMTLTLVGKVESGFAIIAGDISRETKSLK